MCSLTHDRKFEVLMGAYLLGMFTGLILFSFPHVCRAIMHRHRQKNPTGWEGTVAVHFSDDPPDALVHCSEEMYVERSTAYVDFVLLVGAYPGSLPLIESVQYVTFCRSSAIRYTIDFDSAVTPLGTKLTLRVNSPCDAHSYFCLTYISGPEGERRKISVRSTSYDPSCERARSNGSPSLVSSSVSTRNGARRKPRRDDCAP